MDAQSEIVKKGNVSQMDADIGKQQEIDAEREKKKKPGTGPMGVTDISKRRIRLNIPEGVRKILLIILECFILGLLLSVMFSILRFKIGIINFFGWSIFWWIIKFKMPEIVRSYRR